MKIRLISLAFLSIFISYVLTEAKVNNNINEIDDDEDGWVDWDVITTEHNSMDESSRVTEFNPGFPPENTPNMQAQQQQEPEGPGAMGLPYVIENPTPEQKQRMAEGYQRHAFNEYISDQISVHRSLPDFRNPWCKKPGLHMDKLLSASVVMCFHNEALSVLLRSVHSILDRTPEHLLTEIVLVDDSSNLENLKNPLLEQQISSLSKVKLIRSKERLGLIRARMLGAKHAQGPILVFLDSHIEVTTGWLEPMADRITRDGKNVVCPVIDVISDDTLEYKPTERSVTAVGGFNWDLVFVWKTATDEVLRSLKTPADPVPSPTMAGGLFAIHKDFFDRLGQYDDEYEIWGAENLEISFKTWMCGGRLEIIPCSHIGHIYRKRSPYSRNGTESRPFRNYVRLAKVWLDDYAKFYFNKIGNNLGDYGDVSSRIALRERLQCHSFDWFIKNVYPDIFNPKLVVAHGEVRNEAFGGSICLDAFAKPSRDESLPHKPMAWGCHGQGGNQHWYLTQLGELRRDESCLDYAGDQTTLQMYPCHSHKGNQLWNYDAENGFIIHEISQMCLTLDSRDKITVTPCEGRITQRWKISRLNVKRITKLHAMIKEYMDQLYAHINEYMSK